MNLASAEQVCAALALASALLEAVSKNPHCGFKGGDSFASLCEDQHLYFAEFAARECTTHVALLAEGRCEWYKTELASLTEVATALLADVPNMV